jgi:ketosteroid isomerase-like protein
MPETEVAQKIRAGYLAFNDGDFDSMLHALAEDFELHRRLGGPDDSHVIRGRDAFRQYLEPNVFSTMRSEVEEVLESPGRVLIEATSTAVGAGSGIEVTGKSWQVWEHDGSRAHRMTLFASRADAESAAGLGG